MSVWAHTYKRKFSLFEIVKNVFQILDIGMSILGLEKKVFEFQNTLGNQICEMDGEPFLQVELLLE